MQVTCHERWLTKCWPRLDSGIRFPLQWILKLRLSLSDYPSPLANSTAFSTAPALLTHSAYSFAGTESATIPAPDCRYAFLPFMNMVRMAMQESRLPA